MRTAIMMVGSLAWMACGTQGATPNVASPSESALARAPTSTPAPGKKLFLDLHDLGPGKVNAQAVAAAHQKDLATGGKYGVNFKAYWLDEAQGQIHCLVEAPNAEAAIAVHKEAHGLLPDSIAEVTEGR
jgi:hypothetical protein